MASRTDQLRAAALGRTIIFVHGANAPTADEWETVLRLFREAENLSEVRALVYSEGAAPTLAQRGDLNDLLGDRNPRIAVLTPSKFVRAAGMALRWFNPRVRVFNPAQLKDALSHLEVQAGEAASLASTLGRLIGELGLRSPLASAARP